MKRKSISNLFVPTPRPALNQFKLSLAFNKPIQLISSSSLFSNQVCYSNYLHVGLAVAYFPCFPSSDNSFFSWWNCTRTVVITLKFMEVSLTSCNPKN